MHPLVDAGEGLARPGGGWNTFQNTASRPPGRSTCAALAAPATGSTQCQACPAIDRVECPAGRVPGFERRHLDLEPAPPGEVGHPRVGVDAEHPAPGRLELPGGDAGAAADVEHVGAGAGGDDPVHQRAGIAGAGSVVAFGVRAERLRHLPGLMRLGR